jgi:hypothetical protein
MCVMPKGRRSSSSVAAVKSAMYNPGRTSPYLPSKRSWGVTTGCDGVGSLFLPLQQRGCQEVRLRFEPFSLEKVSVDGTYLAHTRRTYTLPINLVRSTHNQAVWRLSSIREMFGLRNE